MEPYTLGIKEASQMFSFAPRTLYNMINDGKLIRGKQYMKVGGKVLIKREEFIKWMEEKDGCQQTG